MNDVVHELVVRAFWMTLRGKFKQLVEDSGIRGGVVKGDFEPSLPVFLDALPQKPIACQVGLHIIPLELATALFDVVGVSRIDGLAIKPELTEREVKVCHDLDRSPTIADRDDIQGHPLGRLDGDFHIHTLHTTDTISSHKGPAVERSEITVVGMGLKEGKHTSCALKERFHQGTCILHIHIQVNVSFLPSLILYIHIRLDGLEKETACHEGVVTLEESAEVFRARGHSKKAGSEILFQSGRPIWTGNAFCGMALLVHSTMRFAYFFYPVELTSFVSCVGGYACFVNACDAFDAFGSCVFGLLLCGGFGRSYETVR